MSAVTFKVGNKYANRKGPFEVISIDRNSMTIRWDNGESISTSIEQQQRIIEGMERERQASIESELKSNAKRIATHKVTSRLGRDFKGLKESDFKEKVTGTDWRSHACLGGAVTERLYTGKLVSWSIPRTPIIHWDTREHRQKGKTYLQAKFFAGLDENTLHYGFYIEHSDKSSDNWLDWNAFLLWLNNTENEIWLKEISEKNDLSIYNKGKKSFTDMIKSRDNQWIIQEKSNEDIDSLSAFLKSLPEDRWLDLIIGRIEDKEGVLSKKESIADDISQLFETLMPLYKASTEYSM